MGKEPTKLTRIKPEPPLQPTIRRRPREVDAHDERAIITGMIVSNVFLKEMIPLIPDLFQEPFGRRVASWCAGHYDKYKRAPGKEIESVYMHHMSEVSEEEAQIIGDLLASLNGDYVGANEKFDIEANLDKARSYSRLVSLKNLQSKVQQSILSGSPDEAESHIREWQESRSRYRGHVDLLKTLVDIDENPTIKIPQRPSILGPLIREGSLTLIYAERGVGKSLFSVAMGLAICTGSEIGPWRCDNPFGVLYVDGEMHISQQWEERVLPLTKGEFSGKPRRAPFKLYSTHLRYLNVNDHYNPLPAINLARREDRDEIYTWLQNNTGIGLVVLDNVASLTPGLDENSKQDWDPINQWLISMRHLNAAVVLLHQAGRSGKPRGTSGREDAMDNIVYLELPPNYNPQDGCHFVTQFEKVRGLRGQYGSDVVPTEFQFTKTGESTIIETKHFGGELKTQIIAALGKGRRAVDIAGHFRKDPGYISRVRKEATESGYLGENGRLTDKGERFYGNVEVDF